MRSYETPAESGGDGSGSTGNGRASSTTPTAGLGGNNHNLLHFSATTVASQAPPADLFDTSALSSQGVKSFVPVHPASASSSELEHGNGSGGGGPSGPQTTLFTRLGGPSPGAGEENMDASTYTTQQTYSPVATTSSYLSGISATASATAVSSSTTTFTSQLAASPPSGSSQSQLAAIHVSSDVPLQTLRAQCGFT